MHARRVVRRPKPHWVRAPVALLTYPTIFAVVLVASLLVGLATATAPLFAAASASAVLSNKLIEVAPLGAGLEVTRTSNLAGDADAGARFLAQSRRRGGAVTSALTNQALAAGRISTLLTDRLQITHRGIADEGRLLSRTKVRPHLHAVWVTTVPGIWVSDLVALHLRLGDDRAHVVLAGHGRRLSVPVGNLYRSLLLLPPSDEWVNFSREIYPYGTERLLPAPFLFASPTEVASWYARLGGGRIREFWEFPLHTRKLTLVRARAYARQFDDIRHRLASRDDELAVAVGCSDPAVRCDVHSSLPAAIALAERDAGAVSAPTRLLADLGLLVALAAVGAAAAFLVARRRGEARMLYTWGERAASFGSRAALEAALPALVGGAAGFAAAWLGVRGLAGGRTIEAGAFTRAARATAIGVGAGLAVFALVAAWTYLHQDERQHSSRIRRVPWELVLLAVGVVLLLRVRTSGGFVSAAGNGGGHPSVAVFFLPLALVGGSALLGIRIFRIAFRRSRRGPRSPALFLALRRVAHAPDRLSVLATLCAVSLGALFYAATLATSLEHAVREKAAIAVGGDAAATVDAPAGSKVPFPVTFVRESYAGAAIGGVTGDQVDVIGIDPRTLTHVIRWRNDWGPPPVKWVNRLVSLRHGRLPVVVTQGLPPPDAIWIGGERVPVDVVGSVEAFPGMTRDRPFIVVSAVTATRAAEDAGAGDPFETAFTAAWARGRPADVKRALERSRLLPEAVVSTDDVIHDPDVTVSRRTYTFLYALGLTLGFVTLLGIALYLVARQRSQAIASALSRRMGLTSRAAVISLSVELLAILGFAGAVAGVIAIAAAIPVVTRTDPLPTLAPSPAQVIPTLVIAATFAALAAAAFVAAVSVHVAASRADAGEELRLV
jgi:putative ABC transport system permease protein